MVSQNISKPFALHHINRAIHRKVIPDGSFKAYARSLCTGEVLKCMRQHTEKMTDKGADSHHEDEFPAPLVGHGGALGNKGRKGRRWSLDIISPFFHPKKRSNAGLPETLDTAHMEPRLSISSLSASLSEGSPLAGFPHAWRRTRRGSERDAFLVVHSREEESYVVTVGDEGELRTLVEAARMEKKEERVSSYRVIVAATRQSRSSSDSSPPCHHISHENLLQQMQQHLQAVAEHSANTDDRLTLVTELLQSEQQYCDSLQILYDQYAEPLRKFSSLSIEDHVKLFVGVEPVFKQSAALIEKLGSAVNSDWDTASTLIGELFTNRFWKNYDNYYDSYEGARQFLEAKLGSDKAFSEFCQLRQQNGVLSLQSLLLLPIKRIRDYDKYLNDLLDDTESGHPDFEELSKAASRVRNMVKDREEEEREIENEVRMDTVQERFPYDDLQLKDKDKSSTKPRGLTLRRRSAPSAVVFRSLSSGRSRSSANLLSQSGMGRKDDTFSTSTIKQAADSSRLYVLEGPVQFAMGMQTQDRYLFLFNDLLLVAKQKNSTTFKLKFRVPLCDVWLSTCVDEVTELTRPQERSFVVGWPTCNVAATFKDTATKENWMAKLTEHVESEKQRVELKEVPLKVVLRDENKTESCVLTVSNTQQAKDVLQDSFAKLSIPESDSKDYRLWVRSGKDEPPYPLIGHETPFSIRVSYLREVARSRGEDNMTLAELSGVIGEESVDGKLEFILTTKKSPKKHSLDESSHKSMKKSKKSSPLLNLFKRGPRDDKDNNNTASSPALLFGRPLASVCDSDNFPPKPIVDLLVTLCREGPQTMGILRKNANMRQGKELRDRMDRGEQLEEQTAIVAGGLVKDYLRNLPDPLLMESLHAEWVKMCKVEDPEEKMQLVKQLLSQMPACNVMLLKRILCALHHIQLRQEVNKMTSYNLSLCIAPSLLWHKDSIDLSVGAPAVEFMIDRCVDIFGPEVLQLLEEPKSRPDSGTDSDSYHSVLSMPETGNSDSIDSLVERELYAAEGDGDEESNSTLVKSHLSPNLSRDSGLTLSDTQLNEEECAEHGDARHGSKSFHHRSAMHDPEQDDYESDCHQGVPHAPVPPPRRRTKRVGVSSGEHANRIDSGGGGIRARDKRHTLHSSVSSSQLLDHLPRQLSSSAAITDTLRPALTHPSFSTDYDQPEIDRQELCDYKKPADIGMLRKSASGAHLILDDETLPRKQSECSISGMVNRQTSGADSTPPHSPQSKYSYSSRDSVISDMSCGFTSRENSIASAPQTPDAEHLDRRPPWLPVVGTDPAGDRRLAHSLHLPPQHLLQAGEDGAALSASYSSSSQLRNDRYFVSPPASPENELESPGFSSAFPTNSRDNHAYQHVPQPPWKSKFREPEDVAIGSSPQIHITKCSSGSEEKLDLPGHEDDTPRTSPSSSSDAFPLEIPHGQSHASLPIKQISRYSQNFAKSSPPPRVLLQSLRSPRSGMDPAPVRASHDSDIVAQVQRAGFSSASGEQDEEGITEEDNDRLQGLEGSGSSEDTANYSKQAFDAARSMEAAIKDTEYITVKPKLTFIHREESMNSTVSSYSSGSGSSVGKDSLSSLGSADKSSLSSVALSISPSHSSSSSSSGSSNATLSGDHSRPCKPPDYDEAVQRSRILKQDAPVDAEALAQKEASKKAKLLFEDSLQLFMQNRLDEKNLPHVPAVRKISDPGAGAGSSNVSTGSTRSPADQSCSATSTSDDMYVSQHRSSGKSPRQIYLESVQKFEKQQSAPPQASEQKTRTSDSLYPTTVQQIADSGSSPTLKDNFSEVRTRQRKVASVNEPRSQQRTLGVESRAGAKRDQRPRSMLDIPFSSNLHRSFSDSADRLNKLEQKGSQSHCEHKNAGDSEGRDSVKSGVNSAVQLFVQSPRRKISETAVYEQWNRSESNSLRPNLRSTHFYNPDNSPRRGQFSPASRSPRSQSPRQDTEQYTSSRVSSQPVHTPRVDSSVVSPPREVHAPAVSVSGEKPIPKPTRSESPGRKSSRSSSSAAAQDVHVSSSSSQGGANSVSHAAPAATSKLGWSVQNLRKLYNSDDMSRSEEQTRESSRAPSRSSSSAARPGPPPYQDPPPFRRLQDKSRLSTSSSSSNGSSSAGRSSSPNCRGSGTSVKRLGPQNALTDFSSSEELMHQNSSWSRSRSGSGNDSGQSDVEPTNAFADISYV